MTCPGCGHAAPASAKFCPECGRRLSAGMRPAPAPRTYTPPHLAEKILSSRSAVQGERKYVTVLFADVKGSLELAELVEAETWHAILDRFFAILADGIHRVEGTVNQYTGDGVMALFGAPIAHEDHAQRACHAALALQDDLRRYADELRVAHGLNFSVRMGLNSGEVVVGRIGDDLRMDYTAQGHTVGLAARMEQLAEPGSVLLTEHTARLVAGYFALRDLGPAHVKGAAEPLHVFRLEGAGPARTRLDRSRARGLAGFVGRSGEMSVLDGALARALEGKGAVAGVEGEAGVGKSRLCAEFVARCRARGLAVHEAHCPSHGRTVPFLPILALLRSLFGIGEQEEAAAAREKIAGRLLERDDSARDALPVLYEFLGVADAERPAPRMDPEARQRVLFTFVRRLVEGRRGGEAVLLFVDDLHWIDAASDAFLAELVDAVPGTRTLLLLNYRPEYQAPWEDRPSFLRVDLAPLVPAEAIVLLDGLLGTQPDLEPLRARILERTGGNPFFLEEVVQSLLSDGSLALQPGGAALLRPVDTIRIPDTVHAVLAARIDRLAEPDKAVLQTASVVGKSFDAVVLERALAVLGDGAGVGLAGSLRRLDEAGLIVGDGAKDGERFSFKHPLTQEVAYRSQLGARRERVHLAVAGVLESLHADRLDEVAAILAHHCEEGRAPLEAARWHRRAAEWAGVSDLAESVRHWRRVRELAVDLPDSAQTRELRIWAGIRLLDFGWRTGMPLSEATSLFEEGRSLAERAGEARAVASFLDTYGVHVGMTGDVDGGLALVTESARLAQTVNDEGMKLQSAVALVQAQAMAGALHAARATLAGFLAEEPADLSLGSFARTFSPYLYLVMMRGHVHTEMGRLQTARLDLDRVRSMAADRGEVELLGWAHEFSVYLALALGEVDAARAHAEKALAGAERIGGLLSRASARFSVAAAELAASAWEDCIASSERGLAILRESGGGKHWESRGLSLLAGALAGAGESARALSTADAAEAASLRGGNRAFECFSCLALVRARRLAAGTTARAAIERPLARVEAVVAATGAELYAPPVHEERAALARLLGDLDGERRERALARAKRAAIEAEEQAARIGEA